MYTDGQIYMGLADGERVCMKLNMANRHGLIAGATGTGKTITMKVMAESFSDAGVPVFLCDVKGDVSGLAMPGTVSDSMEKRIDRFGIRDVFGYQNYPVCFWDIYQEKGHPVRATVSDMGPDLLARLLDLSPVQEGVLNIIFRIADDKGLLLIDLKDLRMMVNYVADHKEEYILSYGNMTTQTLGAIVRALLPLENQGGNLFFGQPDLDITDWIRKTDDGSGVINILDCVKLVQNPKLYAGFLLWMMAELFEKLPEAGDLEKPKLVFFFDEAHLLFADAPKVLVQRIEQMVKLIRSKGVGIYFVTQSPGDIPDAVLAQLSNRVQHALHAYTPAEQKAVKAAALSFRANPAFKTEDAIGELGVGEALTSFLDEKGVPQIVQRTGIICPQSLMGPAAEEVRKQFLAKDGMAKYDTYYDAVSAYEVLSSQKESEAKAEESAAARIRLEKEAEAAEKERAREAEAAKRKMERELETMKKQREREAEAARRKSEREWEAKQRKMEREAEREAEKAARRDALRRQQMEEQLIGVGMEVLRRGIFGNLFR